MIEAKPDNLIGDRAYDSDKLDEELKQEGVELLAALIFARYRFSGGMFLMAAANCAWAAGSTGLCLILVLAGSLPRKLSPFQFFDGLMGLGTKPPPQFGQTFPNTLSTQVAQNVHS
jgi:hypothetical protein